MLTGGGCDVSWCVPPSPSAQHTLGCPAVRQRDRGRGVLVGLADFSGAIAPPEPACSEKDGAEQRGTMETRGGKFGIVMLGQRGPEPSILLPRALPESCAAGSGGKRLHRSRTANASGGNPPPES